MRVIGSVRVSTDEQAAHGSSLEAQAEKITDFCQREGLILLEVCSDPGRTGGDLDRPGVQRALGMLERGEAGGIVVAKLDRLTRSLRDWLELVDRFFSPGKGKTLFVVQDPVDLSSAMGWFLSVIRVAFSELELKTGMERTTAVMSHKRTKGERLGTIPYGYRLGLDGKTLEPDPGELLGIEAMHICRLAGRSHREIARYLNEETAFRTKSGKPWGASTVAQIIGRENTVRTCSSVTLSGGGENS